jgi:hypothetical protein
VTDEHNDIRTTLERSADEVARRMVLGNVRVPETRLGLGVAAELTGQLDALLAELRAHRKLLTAILRVLEDSVPRSP